MSGFDIKCKIMEEQLRSFWPEWHVAERIGRGAFGNVFRIYRDNYGIHEESALKVIEISGAMETYTRQSLTLDKKELPETAGIFGDSSEMTDSQSSCVSPGLISEIQILEVLRGAPNIVAIEDFYYKEDVSSFIFLRMELLTCFQDELIYRQHKRPLFSITEVIKIGKDICTALMYCEEHGIIHRDIKPANIFIDGYGNYKVGDFGVSKCMDTVHMVQTMTGVGTISYMAPEIFAGRSYNNTVDIYALGLILYQILNNGRIPFLPIEGPYTAQEIDSANYKRLHNMLIPSLTGIQAEDETIDAYLDSIIRKACAFNPDDRYHTAKEFYDALNSCGKPHPSIAIPMRSIYQSSLKETIEWKGMKTQSEKQTTKKAIFCGFITLIVFLIWVGYIKNHSGSPQTSNEESVISTQNAESEETEENVSSIIGADDRDIDNSSLDNGQVVESEELEMTQEVDEEISFYEITDSWEEIISAVEDGSYEEKYPIGCTKELDLGDEGVVRMQLVAKDEDVLADGSGNAHTTWVAKDLLNTYRSLNLTYNDDGWSGSDMRTWLRENVLPLFPLEIRTNIKMVAKYSSFRDEDVDTIYFTITHYLCTFIKSEDEIWIPSYHEVFEDNSIEVEGPDYTDIYRDNDSRIKCKAGTSGKFSWWLRSLNENATWDYVLRDGSYGFNTSNVKMGVVIGFCL